jgi:hypothetical protein
VLERVVLTIKEIEGNHSGLNLTPVLMDVIRDWGIALKLGYIVMDNASNNNTIILALSTGIVGGELQQDKNPHKIHQSAKRDSIIKQ